MFTTATSPKIDCPQANVEKEERGSNGALDQSKTPSLYMTISASEGGEVDPDGQREPLLAASIEEKGFLQVVKQRVKACVKCYWDSYVWLILTASVGYSLMMVCVKVLSEHAPVFQITAFRGVVGCIILCGFCLWNGVPLTKPREKMPLILARAATGAFAFGCVAVATVELPLSESAFMANSYPVVTAVLSWMFGMEHLGVLSWSGVVGCLVGNALMARPPFIFGGDSSWGTSRIVGLIAAVLGNCLTAITFILLRYIGKSVDSSLITAYMHLFSIFVSGPFLAVKCPMPINLHPSRVDWVWYAITGFLGIFAQVVQSRALQIGPPTKTTTLLMTNMLLTGFIGVTAFHESMTRNGGIGAAVVLFSVMLVKLQSAPKIRKQSGDYQYLMLGDDSGNEELEL